MSAKAKPNPDSCTNMVLGQLITNNINDPRIIQAISSTAREDFVPEHIKHTAYIDEDLDFGGGRSLLAPLTFARLLSIAQITPDCRVLDIGCLNGYSTAVLSKLAAHVVSIEMDDHYIAYAKKQLKSIKNINLQTVASLADGYGLSAPYDVIIVQGAISFVPEIIGLQLSVDGRMATIFNRRLSHTAGKGLLIKRIEGMLQYRNHFDGSAALLPGFERHEGFTL